MICRGRKGLTLVEVMMSLTIMGIILVPISLTFYSGYSNYYYENDDMINIQKTREVMDNIISDLRMNESSFTEVTDEGNTLFIKEGLFYTYSPGDKMIFKNGIPIFENAGDISINYFKFEETMPADYDSSLINVTLKMKVRRSEEITLQNSYRRKISS